MAKLIFHIPDFDRPETYTYDTSDGSWEVDVEQRTVSPDGTHEIEAIAWAAGSLRFVQFVSRCVRKFKGE